MPQILKQHVTSYIYVSYHSNDISKLNVTMFKPVLSKKTSGTIISKCVSAMATFPFHHVPIVIEQSGKGERAFDIYSRLLKERIICLMGPITDVTSSVTIAQLLYLQSESTSKPIHMYINSPGGVITSGLGIYDTMQYIMPPISTWCVGQCCSMASLLLAAGTKGNSSV